MENVRERPFVSVRVCECNKRRSYSVYERVEEKLKSEKKLPERDWRETANLKWTSKKPPLSCPLLRETLSAWSIPPFAFTPGLVH